MRELRVVVLWTIIAVAVGGFLLRQQRLSHRPVLRVALVDSNSGERLRLAVPALQKKLSDSAGKPVDIHVFSIPYDDLYRSLHEQEREEAVPSQQFDVVLVDDPWIAELASKHVLSPLPDDWLENPALKRTILNYAPEFLRVDFYRNTAPRRPQLDDLWDVPETVSIGRAAAAFRKGYKLYGLPYVGNMQALTVSPNIKDGAIGAVGGSGTTWSGLRAQTDKGPVRFYSRLGSDNGALIDFLPILWSYGGCLVSTDRDGREVTGFTARPDSPEWRALDTSIAISRRSSPEYSRFDEDVLFRFVSDKANLLSISWLALRGRSLQAPGSHGPGWYQMPVNEEGPSPGCADNEERRGTRRSGGLGLWSLAIEAGASERELAAQFVQYAVEDLWNDAGSGDPVCSAHGGNTPAQLEELPPDRSVFYPSPLLSKMSCATRKMVALARPRISHPEWHKIEHAVGLRVREAHWQTIGIPDATCRTARDVQRILNGSEFTCPVLPPGAP